MLRAAEDYMAHQQEFVRRNEGSSRKVPERLRAAQSFGAADAGEGTARTHEQAVGRTPTGGGDGDVGSGHVREGPGEQLEILAITAARAEAS